MSKPFDDCRAAGGKIRTKTLSGGRYMHICFLNGKSYAGDVKTKQSGPVTKGAFLRAAKKMV